MSENLEDAIVTLLVDDSDITLNVLEGILTKQGHVCIGAQNGLEALVCLESVPKIQLIITDVDMPSMNGLELLGEMTKRKEWNNIGKMICSNQADTGTIQQAKTLGCQAFLLKPVSEEHLVIEVQTVLGEPPRILQDPLIPINKFGLTSESYKVICLAFHEKLGQTIQIMENEDADFSLKQRHAEIRKIQDGAEWIGASRLAKLYKPAKTQTASEQEIYFTENSTKFLREFQALHTVLNSTLS